MGDVLTDGELRDLADRLVSVRGVVGVMLGGSRATGAARPDSDVDLGLYYRSPLDVDGLRGLARSVASVRGAPGAAPELTEPGGWGPWVDGGGWMAIDGVPVDWIYRDLDRVRRSADSALAGDFQVHFQVGHPFGIPDFAYAGEVALGVVLADPEAELASLQRRLDPYPPALGRRIVDRLDEARFLLGGLGKPAARSDTTFVAGCLFRVVTLCAHAVHARAGHWVVNEKGIVESAGRLPTAPVAFTERAHGVLARLGRAPDTLLVAIEEAAALVAETATG